VVLLFVVLLLVVLLLVALLGTGDDSFYPLRTWYRGVSYDRDKYPDFSGPSQLYFLRLGSGSKKIAGSDPDPVKVICVRNTGYYPTKILKCAILKKNEWSAWRANTDTLLTSSTLDVCEEPQDLVPQILFIYRLRFRTFLNLKKILDTKRYDLYPAFRAESGSKICVKELDPTESGSAILIIV